MSQSQKNWKWGGGGRKANPGEPISANPIFESWIMEWREDAEAKDSKMKYVFAKALKSLRKYPILLRSGKECSILECFGSHMCKLIDTRMAKEGMSSEPAPGDDLEEVESQPVSVVSSASGDGDGQRRPRGKGTGATKKSTNVGKKKQTGTSGHPKPSSTCTGPAPASSGVAVVTLSTDDEDEDKVTEVQVPRGPAKKPKGKPTYVPAYRSGGYAILLALVTKEKEPGYRGFMTKTELLGDAQNYCDSSLTRPDTTKSAHYTAWNSMAMLLKKELVLKQGSPAKYMLTPEGRELAERLHQADHGTGAVRAPPQLSSEDLPGSSGSRESQYEDSDQETEVAGPTSKFDGVRLPPGRFEVILYVDTCETNGKSKSQELINELQKNGVTLHVTRLSVGDFVWVCREVTTSTAGNRNRLTIGTQAELVLPFVVERKRSDDLAHSIRDGRYREQKYRLGNTKLQVIYLIESYGKGDWGLQEGALEQAIASTQIKNNFQIQKTASIKDTCGYLTFMTRRLKAMFERKTVIGCNRENYSKDLKSDKPNEQYLLLFSDFNDFSGKKTNWNVTSLFARQLIRMRGMSVDKAYAIVQLYPTVLDLCRAYSDCDNDKEKGLLLANIRYGNSDRNIGPMISKKIAMFYNSDALQ